MNELAINSFLSIDYENESLTDSFTIRNTSIGNKIGFDKNAIERTSFKNCIASYNSGAAV